MHFYLVKVRIFEILEENVIERGSIYHRFPLSGSAWGAIWGRVLKKEFFNKNRFWDNCSFLGHDFGRFRRTSDGFSMILARHLHEKWYSDIN